MGKGLWEVAQGLTGETDFLGVQPDVVTRCNAEVPAFVGVEYGSKDTGGIETRYATPVN